MRVLIAERDAAIRQSLVSLIAGLGYEPVPCEDGENAWELLQQPGAPQLVILDHLLMNQVSGTQLCQRLQNGQTHPPRYVIILSNAFSAEEQADSLDAGADHYMTKPVDESVLRARLAVGTRTLARYNTLAQLLPAARPKAPVAPQNGNCRILIAEDDLISRTILEENLHSWGYEVVAVSDGAQAWEILQRDDAPPVVILDWMMPKLSGLDVCQRLRQRSDATPTYVLLLTAKGLAADIVSGLDAGADDYLTKPFQAIELRARVKVGVRIAQLQLQLVDRAVSAEFHYKSLFDHALDGIYERTLEGRFTACNPAMLRILGYPDLGTMLAKANADDLCVNPDARAQLNALWEQRETAKQVQCQARRADGTLIWISKRVMEVRDKQGNLTGYQGMVEDITARRAAEHGLQESNSRLTAALEELEKTRQHVIQQERLRALGQMASGIAHDFNNALVPIMGYVDMILANPAVLQDQERVLRYLRTVRTSATDATAIVSRMSDFYRQRENTETLVPVLLHAMVEQVIELTRPRWQNQAQAKGVDIKVYGNTEEVPAILGNEAELREALGNLLFNAVDAITEKAELESTKGTCSSHSITLTTRLKAAGHGGKPNVVLAIEDSGTGMTENVRQCCLEPFFSTKGERGTGMGLAMVFGIVKRHGGTVDIVSSPGQGTCFILSFPQRERTARPLAVEESAEWQTSKLRILVADDDAISREVICEYFVEDGHAVVAAASSSEALALFDKGKFDLVLTDRTSGATVATTVKQRSPTTQVIMLTGFGDMMQDDDNLPPDVDVLLSKPFTIKSIRAALKTLSKSRTLPAQPNAAGG